MSGKESGGDYKSTSTESSAVGKYQHLWGTHSIKIGEITGVKTKEEYKNNPEAQEKYQAHLVKQYQDNIPKLREKYDLSEDVVADETIMMMQHYMGSGDIQVYLKELMATGDYDAAQAALDKSILTRLQKKDPKAVLPKNTPIVEYLSDFVGKLNALPVEDDDSKTPVKKSTVVDTKPQTSNPKPKVTPKVTPAEPVTYNPNPTFEVPDLYPQASKKQEPIVEPPLAIDPNSIFPTSGMFPPSPLIQQPKTVTKTVTKTTPTATSPNTPPKVNQPATPPKKEEKTSTNVPGSLISPSTITNIVTDIATSKVGELVQSAIDQGIGAAASQLWSGVTAPNEGLQQSIKPLPEKETNVASSKTTKVNPKTVVKEKPPAYVPLGSKVENYKGDPDRYLEPFKVNVDSAKFGVRSRKEEGDVQTKGVVFTTYKPWTYASSPEFTKGANSFDYFLVVNNETGDLKVTTNPWRDNNSLLNKSSIRANPNMLTTGSYGRVVKELNTNGLYNDGIKTKTLGYVSFDGKKASIPVFGIGNGSDLGGYVGGKLLLAHPDGSNPTIIYGSAEIVIDQFNKYKKENKLQNVLVIDADGKSYAQSYQTKSGVIPGSVLTSEQWDNANTSTAGSGNILYLK